MIPLPLHQSVHADWNDLAATFLQDAHIISAASSEISLSEMDCLTLAMAKRQKTSACSGLTDTVHSEEGLETEATVEDAPLIPSVTSYYFV